MSTLRSLFVVGLSLMSWAVLQAQETTQRKDPAVREQPARTGAKAEGRVSGARSAGQLDRHFVTCLKSENKGEITIATLASQKASNPEVKAFAQELVKDHTDFLAKLERFEQANPGSTPQPGIRTETRTETRSEATTRKDSATTDPANPNRDKAKPRTDRPDSATNPPAARTDVRVDVNRGDAPAARGSGDLVDQLTQIKLEINERCVASAQRELGSKEGSEFDKCFVGMQIGGHMHMVDALTVLNNHASPELQQILDEGLQKTQQHLDHAKQLAKKLEGSTATTAEERATTAPAKTARKSTDKEK